MSGPRAVSSPKSLSPQTTWRTKRSDVSPSLVPGLQKYQDPWLPGGTSIGQTTVFDSFWKWFLMDLKGLCPKIYLSCLIVPVSQACLYFVNISTMAKSSPFFQIRGGSNFQISRSSYFPARFISWDSVAATEIISDRKLLLCSHLVMAAAGTRLKEDFFDDFFTLISRLDQRRFLRRFLHIDFFDHWPFLLAPPLSLSFPSSIEFDNRILKQAGRQMCLVIRKAFVWSEVTFYPLVKDARLWDGK